MLACVLSNFNSSTPAIQTFPLHYLGRPRGPFQFSHGHTDFVVQESFVAVSKWGVSKGEVAKSYSSGLARYQLES